MQRVKVSFDLSLQDGNVEENIPSPELFPIHHLDEFEYFPGDFVVDAKGNLFSSDRDQVKNIMRVVRSRRIGSSFLIAKLICVS